MGKGIIRQAELGYVNPFVPLMSTCRERVLERPRPVPSPERGHERELAQDVHSSRSHQQDGRCRDRGLRQHHHLHPTGQRHHVGRAESN